MKAVALIALILTLGASLFTSFGAQVNNNSVAIALMILLLVLFSDLKEFNFWGLSGKKKEEEIKKLQRSEIVNEDTDLKPSPYKLRKAVKEDNPDQLDNLKDNFLAISYDIERLLRIIAKAVTRSTEESAQLSPQEVLDYLEDKEFLTPQACEAIEKIREIRSLIIGGQERLVPLLTLEATYQLAQAVHLQLKDWFNTATK